MSALNALKVPGSITFGGVSLGLIRDVMLLRDAVQTPVEGEEYGGEPVDEVLVRVVYRVGLALRGWTTASIQAIYPNVTADEITWPGSVEPGTFRAAGAAELIFTPTDTAHPSFTFDSAIPRAAEVQEVAYQARTEHLLLVEFTAIRAGSGAVTWGL